MSQCSWVQEPTFNRHVAGADVLAQVVHRSTAVGALVLGVNVLDLQLAVAAYGRDLKVL